MGQSDLVVVNPKRYPDPQADWRAAGALDVLDQARIVDDVSAAIGDCNWVVGTSTRMRKIPWPVASAREVASEVYRLAEEDKVVILFGREDNGLTNDELRLCNVHLQIEANPAYASLNLAMAVQVICYEIYQAGLAPRPEDAWDRRLARVDEVNGMLTHLETLLTDSEFLDKDNPGQTMTRLRRMFTRMQLDETEVQILRGIYKHLQ